MPVIRFKDRVISAISLGHVCGAHPHISAGFVTCAKLADDEQRVIYVATAPHQPGHVRDVATRGRQGVSEATPGPHR